MPRTIESDIDLLAAAMSQVLVSVWQADIDGVYCEIDRGYINKYSAKSVRLVSEHTGRPVYYWRDTSLFLIE